MNVRVLGCFGSRVPGRFTSSLLIDQRLLLDAGTIASSMSLEEQAMVDDILLTHAHLDHIVDLAFLADNVMNRRKTPIRIWAPEPVLDALRNHLFNDFIWPDFTKIPSADSPVISLNSLPESGPVEIAGYTINYAQTNHTVYTVGYCLSSESGSLFYSGDTSTTEAIWEMAGSCPNLKIAFIETSFPNRLEWLAEVSGHLTPAMFKVELEKFGDRDVPIKVFHMKPQFLEELRTELAALNDRRLQILDGGETFEI
jgi:ribonuclease BN (tRNA processing enzyme)